MMAANPANPANPANRVLAGCVSMCMCSSTTSTLSSKTEWSTCIPCSTSGAGGGGVWGGGQQVRSVGDEVVEARELELASSSGVSIGTFVLVKQVN